MRRIICFIVSTSSLQFFFPFTFYTRVFLTVLYLRFEIFWTTLVWDDDGDDGQGIKYSVLCPHLSYYTSLTEIASWKIVYTVCVSDGELSVFFFLFNCWFHGNLEIIYKVYLWQKILIVFFSFKLVPVSLFSTVFLFNQMIVGVS